MFKPMLGVTVGKDGGINIQSKSPRVIVIPSSIRQFIYAANIGLNSIVLASTTLGLNKLLFVMVAVIAAKALKQVALVVAVLKLRVHIYNSVSIALLNDALPGGK